jgi:hypothetical protein
LGESSDELAQIFAIGCGGQWTTKQIPDIGIVRPLESLSADHRFQILIEDTEDAEFLL